MSLSFGTLRYARAPEATAMTLAHSRSAQGKMPARPRHRPAHSFTPARSCQRQHHTGAHRFNSCALRVPTVCRMLISGWYSRRSRQDCAQCILNKCDLLIPKNLSFQVALVTRVAWLYDGSLHAVPLRYGASCATSRDGDVPWKTADIPRSGILNKDPLESVVSGPALG